MTARSDDNKLSTNSSMFHKVASRLSEQLLAALAWSARTSTPKTDESSPPTVSDRSPDKLRPSRRSWEQFLAQVVSNLSSAAKTAGRSTTPPVAFTPTTSTTATQHPVRGTTASTPSSSGQQRQRLSALRSYRRPQQLIPRGRHLSRSALNLKSPPAVRLRRLELSTNSPRSRSSKSATTRLPAPTTPPVYLRHIRPPVTSPVDHAHHAHHHHHHSEVRHHRVISAPVHPGAASRPHNVSDSSAWSMPAAHLSAASLFRMLGLWTGNDVNVTSSSSATVADMMRYVLGTRFFTTGTSYIL